MFECLNAWQAQYAEVAQAAANDLNRRKAELSLTEVDLLMAGDEHQGKATAWQGTCAQDWQIDSTACVNLDPCGARLGLVTPHVKPPLDHPSPFCDVFSCLSVQASVSWC
jgi:hypothetical protein